MEDSVYAILVALLRGVLRGVWEAAVYAAPTLLARYLYER